MTAKPGADWQLKTFGKSTVDAVEAGLCVTCEAPDFGFQSEEARREYFISGMCRLCQEEVFGADDVPVSH